MQQSLQPCPWLWALPEDGDGRQNAYWTQGLPGLDFSIDGVRGHVRHFGAHAYHCLDRQRGVSQALTRAMWTASHGRLLTWRTFSRIFKAYKADPQNHVLPSTQELLRKLLQDEHVPRTITVRHQWQCPRAATSSTLAPSSGFGSQSENKSSMCGRSATSIDLWVPSLNWIPLLLPRDCGQPPFSIRTRCQAWKHKTMNFHKSDLWRQRSRRWWLKSSKLKSPTPSMPAALGRRVLWAKLAVSFCARVACGLDAVTGLCLYRTAAVRGFVEQSRTMENNRAHQQKCIDFFVRVFASIPLRTVLHMSWSIVSPWCCC